MYGLLVLCIGMIFTISDQAKAKSTNSDACTLFTIEDAHAIMGKLVAKKDLEDSQSVSCKYEFNSTDEKKSEFAKLWIMYSGSDAAKFVETQFSGPLKPKAGLGERAVPGIGNSAVISRPSDYFKLCQNEVHLIFLVNNKGVFSLKLAGPGTYEQNEDKIKSIAKLVVSRLE